MQDSLTDKESGGNFATAADAELRELVARCVAREPGFRRLFSVYTGTAKPIEPVGNIPHK